MIILADHFGPILFLLSPIYRLFPSASSLLIIQAVFVSLSSILIYLIALDKLKNAFLSFLISLTYLTSPGIISAINFDFHLSTISVLPLTIMLFSFNFKHWRLYWIILPLSLLFKEDIPIFILGLGIYELFTKEKKIGILSIIFALISFYLIKFNVMPFMWKGAEDAYIATSSLPINSPVDLIMLILIRPRIIWEQFFNSPIKLVTINSLLRPFGFFSILSSLSWLTVIPYLFLRFSSNYYQLWTMSYHHNANLIPFLAVSMIFALHKFRIPSKPIIFLLIFLLFSDGLSPNSPVWQTIQYPMINVNNFQYIKSALRTIPSNASVSAQSPILPHLANREKIYLFPELYDAEYIILDKSLSSYPLRIDELNKKIETLRNSKNWKIEIDNQTLIIFKKNSIEVR